MSNYKKELEQRHFLQLEQALKDREGMIRVLQDRVDITELTRNEQIEALTKELTKKDEEINRLQKNIEAELKKTNIDEFIGREMALNQARNLTLTKELEMKTSRLIELEGKFDNVQRDLQRLQKDRDTIQQLFLEEQKANQDLLGELNSLTQKPKSSFEAEEISAYFSRAIDGFNNSALNDNPNVNYVISGMDVELKAHIGKTQDNRILMSTPNILSDSEEALSVVKFTINAVPKDLASDNE